LKFTDEELKQKIDELKARLSVTVVAHFYQRDEVFEVGDITGDSLELAIKTRDDDAEFVLFCGVGFMGQSVKILSPDKRVVMPRIAECSMASMITGIQYDDAVKALNEVGIKSEDILPITYINSDAQVKAKVGEMGGMVCTSSNAKKIITTSLKEGKKILFVPDRCLGQNIADFNPISFAMFCPRHLSGTKSIFLPLSSPFSIILKALELVHTIPPISPTFDLTLTSELIYVIGKISSLAIPLDTIKSTLSSKNLPSIILAIAQQATFGIKTLL